jgi:putative tricarboxylic transport membrane protein
MGRPDSGLPMNFQGGINSQPVCEPGLFKGVKVKMKTADIVAGLVGILVGVYTVWEGSTMPPDVVMKIGPSFFPNILAGFLILSSLALIVTALRGRSKGSVAPLRISDPGVQRALCTLAATLVYCILLKPLGFIPTSLAFMVFMMVTLGRRKPMALVAAPWVVTLSIWVVFEKILHLDLPPGVLAALIGD